MGKLSTTKTWILRPILREPVQFAGVVNASVALVTLLTIEETAVQAAVVSISTATTAFWARNMVSPVHKVPGDESDSGGES